MRRLGVAIVLLVAGAAGLFGGHAFAQAAANADFGSGVRQDLQRLSPSVPPPPGTPPSGGKDFEIALTAPLLFTSNALQTTDDVNTGTKRADVHFNPDLFLGWAHQFERVRVSAAVDASVDRFFTETDVDEDTLFGSLKLSLTDGRSDLFVPYVAYAAEADLRPDFGEADDVLHSFSAGVSSGIGFNGSKGRIPWRKAVHPGDGSVAVSLSAGRRLADPRDFENVFAIAALDFTYVATPQWRFGFTPKVRLRWYDSFEGEFRRDVRFTGILRAAWTPDWLTRPLPSAEIDLTVSFTRNRSTIGRESFSEWDAGPALAFDWRF